MKKTLFFLAMAFLLPNVCFLSSCGGDDDDDAPTNITNVEKNAGDPKMSNDSTAFNVDPDFIPASIDLQKKWIGSYEGWDAVQEENTKIIRELTLTSSRTYTNVIYGTLKGKSEMVKFEGEVGNYVYNASTGIITYTVIRDSVLQYDVEKYSVYENKKHFYDHELPTYTENVKFSNMTNGKRNWITKDTYLQSLTSERIDITFDMGSDNPTPNN